MALSAQNSYADASEFGASLRQVGRGDAPVRSAKPESSIAQSARDRTVNIKAGGKTIVASFVPVVKYFIQKTTSNRLVVTKLRRSSGNITSGVAVVLCGG